MRRAAVFAASVALFAAPAFALTVADVDTDGDSLASFSEMTVTFPDLTSELFAEIDTSDDEMVDEVELTAAIDSGMIVVEGQ